MSQVHFQEDNRNILVAEAFESLEAAEKAADLFLEEISSVDESGSRYLRVQVSGTPDVNDRQVYYFEVVTHL